MLVSCSRSVMMCCYACAFLLVSRHGKLFLLLICQHVFCFSVFLSQSLLRGRFLRNGRVIENERSTSMAENELGLLRQRHTVSGLR